MRNSYIYLAMACGVCSFLGVTVAALIALGGWNFYVDWKLQQARRELGQQIRMDAGNKIRADFGAAFNVKGSK